jgi:hypothetical protein
MGTTQNYGLSFMNNNILIRDNMKKKRTFYRFISSAILLTTLSCFQVKAQYETTVEVSAAPNAQIKAAIEKNSGILLTELNNAQGGKRSLSLKGIDIANDAISSLMTMWEICPFRCDELEIIEPCLHTPTGYQIRNIPVIMEPRQGERFDEDRYQEIVLNYDQNGKVTNLCFAIASSQYKQIMSSDREVTDLRKRTIIVDFVEQFRTAYNRKDIGYLEDIFSDDALIITGKVIQRIKENAGFGLKPTVEYKVQNKKQYLTNLTTVFKNSQRINVIFEDIKVNKHREKEVYGVKLIQHWNSGSYSDKGYLFLLWDFTNPDTPKIHVRTWQPFDETPKEKIFELGDFTLGKEENK